MRTWGRAGSAAGPFERASLARGPRPARSPAVAVPALFTEIRAIGYAGSYGTVRDYLQPFRTLDVTQRVAVGPPKVREVTAWMLRHPDSRNPDEQVKLKLVLANCPHLAAAGKHVTTFAEMMTGLHGEQVDRWIEQVRADDLPQLHSFAAGLQRDHAAVVNGLTLPHSSGAVEGTVNRIKDDLTTDVWSRRLRPTSQANPAGSLNMAT